MLLPANEVVSLQIPTSLDSVVAAISEFAEERRVSRSMVAYKLFRIGKIGKGVWTTLNFRFRDEWIAWKQKQSEKNKSVEGGPNYYVIRRHRVGTALIGLMRRAIDDGNITYTKAGRVLGVRPRNVEPLLSSGQIRGLR
jgi:Zn-dependent peptidase ImmA (M78 family)